MSRKICPNRSRGGLLKHIGNFAVEARASIVSVSRRMHPVLRLTALCVVSIAPLARATPPPAEVLAVMERVADWQLANPSKHPATDWTCGAGWTGMMALASVSPSPRFHDAMIKMGEASHWDFGTPKGHSLPYDADDHTVGQTYLELYLQHKDPAMLAHVREHFDYILAHPSSMGLEFDNSLKGRHRERWSWCDALFMGPPTWVRLYAATGERAYLDFAVKEWWATSDYLYDKDEHLFFRDSTYFGKKEANGKKVFWGRGNGWVMGGLARVLEVLPKDHPARSRFEQQFREMTAKLREVQQPDGLWRASLLDPASYPLMETSSSGFYCFAFAWGINHGLLDRATFQPAVEKAWAALVACVAPDGKLTHVQPIGADPKKFDENSTEIYGVGAFLLAGREVYRLGVNPSVAAKN